MGIKEFPDDVGGGTAAGGQDRCVEVNGCRKTDINPIFDLSSDAKIPLAINIDEDAGATTISVHCSIVADNDIHIYMSNPKCVLRGGVTDGNVGIPDDAADNVLEESVEDAGPPWVFKASGCAVPFYCAGDLTQRGAIFHNN